MGKSAQFKDPTRFTKWGVLKGRLDRARQRGDRLVSRTEEFEVKFHDDFDSFAAEVAHAVRRLVVYRSDRGNFARGLVALSGDLQQIHKALLDSGGPAAGVIRLVAALYRRKDKRSSERHVMNIRFGAPDLVEGEHVVASDEFLRANRLDRFIDRGILLSADMRGEEGQRIRRILTLADGLAYPKNVNLWYYNVQVVHNYVEWRNTDARRKDMTQGTGGRVPFDGYAGYQWGGEWRVYPFQRVAKTYREGWSDRDIRQRLLTMDAKIDNSLGPVRKITGNAGGSGTVHGELARAFVRHVGTLQRTRSHLYSAYK